MRSYDPGTVFCEPWGPTEPPKLGPLNVRQLVEGNEAEENDFILWREMM
jgi:hypothetical protein